MRVLTTLVAAAMVATSSAAMAAPAAHHHKPPKPDLYVPAITTSYAGGQVTAGVYVTNKGKAKAGSSTAAVYLSTDNAYGAGDVSLGTMAIKKLKPNKTDYPIIPYAVPASVTPGAYYVVACADSAKQVKEKKEGNNCGSSTTTVTIPTPSGPPPPPPGFVTITWGASFGEVTANVTAGTGTCTPAGTLSSSGTCSVKNGDATVQLIASNPAPGYTWHTGGWQGPTCDGVVSNDVAGVGATMTLANPTAAKSCTAVFPFI
jgi:CARDB